jgi:hypothetical protein
VNELSLRATLEPAQSLPDQAVVEHDIGSAHGRISSTRVYGEVVYKATITWCIDPQTP